VVYTKFVWVLTTGYSLGMARPTKAMEKNEVSTTKSFDVDAWFAEIDEINKTAGEFMPGGRKQPQMPVREFGF